MNCDENEEIKEVTKTTRICKMKMANFDHMSTQSVCDKEEFGVNTNYVHPENWLNKLQLSFLYQFIMIKIQIPIP